MKRNKSPKKTFKEDELDTGKNEHQVIKKRSTKLRPVMKVSPIRHYQIEQMRKKFPNVKKYYYKDKKVHKHGYNFMFYRQIGSCFDFSTFNEEEMNHALTQDEIKQLSDDLDSSLSYFISKETKVKNACQSLYNQEVQIFRMINSLIVCSLIFLIICLILIPFSFFAKEKGGNIRSVCLKIIWISLFLCCFNSILFYCKNCRSSNKAKYQQSVLIDMSLKKYEYYNLQKKMKHKINELLRKWEGEVFQNRNVFLDFEMSIDEEVQWIRISSPRFLQLTQLNRSSAELPFFHSQQDIEILNESNQI